MKSVQFIMARSPGVDLDMTLRHLAESCIRLHLPACYTALLSVNQDLFDLIAFIFKFILVH